MKVEIFPGFWTLEDVRNSKGKIFIYGDNDARFGKGGQSIIRDEPMVDMVLIELNYKKKHLRPFNFYVISY